MGTSPVSAGGPQGRAARLTSGMQIRPAAPGDIPLVRALFREYAAGLEVDLGFQDFDRELAGLPGAYAPPLGCLLIGWAGADAVGCVAVRPLAPDIAEMKRLYLRPAGRGSGAGEQLARAAIAHARAAGFRLLRLDTLPSMARARALYARLGFREIPPYRHNPVPGTAFLELELGGAPKGKG